MSSLEHDDRASAAVQKTPNRVPLQAMKEKIKAVDYIMHGVTTICVITLANGFKVIGHTTPADPENFNAELRQQFAYETALRQVWPLEGYLLREKLSGG